MTLRRRPDPEPQPGDYDALVERLRPLWDGAFPGRSVCFGLSLHWSDVTSGLRAKAELYEYGSPESKELTGAIRAISDFNWSRRYLKEAL